MELKVGDILRVTRFASRLAGPHDHGWMVVANARHFDAIDPTDMGDGTFIPDVGFMDPDDSEDLWDPGDHLGWMIETTDEFTVVPKDKVPDEVWAALAVMRLLS